MSIHRAIKILVCLCLSLMASAAVGAPLPMKHIGTEQGMSNNYVRELAKDKHNRIWIATELGLNLFDGFSVKSFLARDGQISNDALNAICYHPQSNKLFVGGKFEGMDVIDADTEESTHLHFDGISLRDITDITPASDGGIWITVFYKNLYYYNPENGEIKLYKSFSDNNKAICNLALYDDGKGTLYLGHDQFGLSVIDVSTGKVKRYIHSPNDNSSLPGNNVYVIKEDIYGNVWIGTNNGLALFDPISGTFKTFKHNASNPNSIISDHIYDICEMDIGTLWIASDIGGISILNVKGLQFNDSNDARFTNISSNSVDYPLSSRNIRSLIRDDYGNVWIGNYSTGIDFISHIPSYFNILPYMSESNPGNYLPVWGLFFDKSNSLWAGGENELLLFKENELVKRYNLSEYLNHPYGQVFSITSDSSGNLLLGIYDDGVLKFFPSSGKVERLELGRPNIDVITFYNDYEDGIYIGTENGLYRYDGSEVVEVTEVNNQIFDRSVYGIVKDKNGNLWIGTYGGGISIFDKNLILRESLQVKNGFFSNSVNSIFKDNKDRIWIASRNGLACIEDTDDPKTHFVYDYEDGLGDNFVRSIIQDIAGNIWVSTNMGISLLKEKEKRFLCYDYRDGIPLGNFIEGSVVSNNNGELYFGSLNGISYFNSSNLMGRKELAPVRIIDITDLDGTKLITKWGEKELSLSNDLNSITISYSVSDYSQDGKVEYAYMFEGLDDSWTTVGGDNMVTFRNIPPGTYRFKVKARLRNQNWDENNITDIKIVIEAPLFLRWWAIAIYLGILSIVAYIIFKFYKRKLLLENSLLLQQKEIANEQELNQEKLRFYTNITHELRTPLTLILGPLEDLANDTKVPTIYSNKINVIHRSALKLLNLINQILEFRKVETQNRKLTVSKGNMCQLVIETGLRYKELNQNRNVTFKLLVDKDIPAFYFDADIVSTVLDNLLSNAVKYTPSGEIVLSLTKINDNDINYIQIQVADTGYGIKSEALPHIFDRYYQVDGEHQASGTGIGLALVKSLIEIHHGSLTVESKVGQGTVFTIRLLMDSTYPDALHNDVEEKEINLPSNAKPEADNAEIINEIPSILIVEDNEDLRDYIASSFADRYHVFTAEDGEEGWELARQNIPDIIISDIMMPKMNGIDLCKKIKEDILTSHIPVILLTAKGSLHDKEVGYDSGADSYLTKPFSSKLLLARVRNLLESRAKLACLISSKTSGVELPKNETKLIDAPKISPLDEKFLNNFIGLVKDNITMENLDLNFLTREMSMSQSTLYRKIKGLTGLSINAFVRKIRLKNSLDLMINEGLNISEAAYASGFNDIPYFRSCFKEEYGATPTEYLKSHRS